MTGAPELIARKSGPVAKVFSVVLFVVMTLVLVAAVFVDVFMVADPQPGDTTESIATVVTCWTIFVLLVLEGWFRSVRRMRDRLGSRRATHLRTVWLGPSDTELDPASPSPARVARLEQLPGIERSIGEALYRLGQTPDRCGLTRDDITEIRRTGLRASAWLSGEPLLDQQVAEGVAAYAALSDAANRLLAGRADADAIRTARDRLAAVIGPAT